MNYDTKRATLEQLLTVEVRKLECRASAVTISFDYQFAIYNVGGDRYMLRRLSASARKFLKEGGAIPVELLDD